MFSAAIPQFIFLTHFGFSKVDSSFLFQPKRNIHIDEFIVEAINDFFDKLEVSSSIMGRSPKEVIKNERMGEISFKQISKIVLFVYFITL